MVATGDERGANVQESDRGRLSDEALLSVFGEHLPRVETFARMLEEQGEERGLIGPREVERLWERHILNSAAVVPFLGTGSIADVGSGAGLPGLVVAAMLPDRDVYLIEPMERRVAWLQEVVTELKLERVKVLRGRAEEFWGAIEVDVVTARAVASVDKLVKWCAPLLGPGGHMAFLKGRSASEELERGKYALRKARFSADVVQAPTLPHLEATTVVTLRRDGA